MEDLNQLPTVIPISYDAKRTRNRLAQRRRRGLSYFLQTKNGHANLSNVAAEKQKSLSTLEKGSTSSHSATKEAAQLHNPTPDMLGWAQQGYISNRPLVYCTSRANLALQRNCAMHSGCFRRFYGWRRYPRSITLGRLNCRNFSVARATIGPAVFARRGCVHVKRKLRVGSEPDTPPSYTIASTGSRVGANGAHQQLHTPPAANIASSWTALRSNSIPYLGPRR